MLPQQTTKVCSYGYLIRGEIQADPRFFNLWSDFLKRIMNQSVTFIKTTLLKSRVFK